MNKGPKCHVDERFPVVFVVQLAKAPRYMHSMKLVHRRRFVYILIFSPDLAFRTFFSTNHLMGAKLEIIVLIRPRKVKLANFSCLQLCLENNGPFIPKLVYLTLTAFLKTCIQQKLTSRI